MLSAKNYSPQQVAAFTALSIALLAGLAVFFSDLSWKVALGTLVALYSIGYLLIFFVIQRFVYRKIKLIYKLIYQTKASKREEFYYRNILPQKSIAEVNKDVEEWAETHTAEIETLKKNEAYRKEFLLNLSHELKT